MLTGIRNNEKGAASIIIVIFMSIILTIVTIGFLRVALNEQRIATDDDLNSRAFYAAESGVEDARRAIRESLADPTVVLNEASCDVPDGYQNVLSPLNEFDTEITCMRIDFNPESIRTEMTANQTRQFEVNPVNPSGAGVTNIGTITLDWHIDAPVNADGDGTVPAPFALRGNQTTITPEDEWNFPAMMQVSFISYPQNNIERTNIVDTTMWISPGTGSGQSNGALFSAGGANVLAPNDGAVLVADCADNDGNYACTMEFDMGTFPSNARNLEMRITNLYQPTSFRLTMREPGVAGDELLFDGVQVVADVTARAGAVFRRVEAILDLTSPNLLPEFTIQSAEDICKDFSFTDVQAGFDGQPNSSCTVLGI